MKWFLAIVLIIIFCFALTGCDGRSISDSNIAKYEHAIIVLPTGELIEGTLDGYFYTPESKTTFVNVQIDGKWYCVHSLNVAFYE